jgi:hypothetical protein
VFAIVVWDTEAMFMLNKVTVSAEAVGRELLILRPEFDPK